jgi:ribonucleotide reductase beta subunit family protein with ferritin-like domain
MQAFAKANEFVRIDECLHAAYGCYRYTKLESKSLERSTQIIKEAVELEIKFFNEIMIDDIDELTKEKMAEYIRFSADNICRMCDIPLIYKALSPFPFMADMDTKTNFHEELSTDYIKHSIKDSIDWRSRFKSAPPPTESILKKRISRFDDSD